VRLVARLVFCSFQAVPGRSDDFSRKGIQVVHGLGGGTGGGMGSLLSQHMLDQYPDKILKFYSVIPSRISMSIPEVYNTVLTLQYLDDNIHQIFCMDYDTIDRIHKENQDKEHEYNWISSCMSGITTCLRSAGVALKQH